MQVQSLCWEDPLEEEITYFWIIPWTEDPWWAMVHGVTKSWTRLNRLSIAQFSSVRSLSLVRLCDPMNCSTPGLPIHHQLLEFTQTHFQRVSDAIQQLHLCCPLLLQPSIFQSIRVFSNESALCVRWPKYWSFSFNISPSNEHPGLISFRMDWLDLLTVQRSRVFFNSFLYSPTLTSIHDYWKNHSLD